MEPFTLPEGKPERSGEVYTFSNGAKYVGAIRNGKMHGFGSFEDPTGSKYTGDWKDGKQHGQGVCETADGERYSGAYAAGLPHGKGTYRFKNGNIYEGEYQDGKICGHGSIRFPDNRRFEGEFKDNKKNGFGRYEGANGIYEGSYVNGKKSGHGCFTWIDGSRYEGPWENDVMHGDNGIKVEKDGRTFKVKYKMGKLGEATPMPSSSASAAMSHQSLPASLRGYSEDKSAGRAATASGFKHLVDTSARGKTIDEEEEEEEEEEEGQRSWLSEQWEEFNYAVLGCGGRRDRVIRRARDSCGGPDVWSDWPEPKVCQLAL